MGRGLKIKMIKIEFHQQLKRYQPILVEIIKMKD